jgi:hypothetical protein
MFPSLYEHSKKNMTVVEAMHNGNWIKDLTHDVTMPIFGDYVMLWIMVEVVSFDPLDTAEDQISWTQSADCRDQPSALAGIDRRLLLGSTVGSSWDRPSALSPVTESTIKRTNTHDVGVRRSSVGDVLEIDRKLQGELC